MIIPDAESIEGAADDLKTVDPKWLADQQTELSSFGPGRAIALGASGLSGDFRIGYELGIQTARLMVTNNAALILAKVKPEDVL